MPLIGMQPTVLTSAFTYQINPHVTPYDRERSVPAPSVRNFLPKYPRSTSPSHKANTDEQNRIHRHH